MALSGNSGVDGGTAPKLRIDWSASQSTSGNYSNVTAKVYLVATYNVSFGSTKSGSVTVDGQTKNFSTTHNIRGAGTHLLTTQTFRVAHRSDGSKSFSYSAKYSINITYSGSWIGTLSRSSSGTLDTIPRRSSIGSLSTGTVGSSYTVPIDRASSGFTHRAWYTNPAGSQVSIATSATTSATFTIPISDANGIPGKTGTGTIRLDTYSGSTRLGSYYKDFTISVPDTSTFRPSVSKPSAVISGSGLDKNTIGAFVQGYSRAYLSGSASGSYGASISSQTIEIRKGSRNKMWGSSSSYTTGVLTESGTYSVVHWVRDSRGHTNSNSTTVEVLAYSPPRLSNFSAERLSYARTTIGYSINSSFTTLSGKNKLRVKIDRRPTDGIWSNVVDTQNISTTPYNTSFNRAGYSEAQTYDIRIVISDTMGHSETSETAIATSKVPLSIDRSEGIGVGKIHERGALDANGDIYISGNIEIAPEIGAKTPGFRMVSQDDSGHAYIEYYGPDNTRRAYIGIPNSTNRDLNIYNEQSADIKLYGRNIKANGHDVWSNGVVDSGVNSNGEWVRFPNGIQICFGRITGSNTDTDYLWSYPNSFMDGNARLIATSDRAGGYNNFTTMVKVNGSSSGYIRVERSGGNINVSASVVAIGRWK